MAASFGSRSRTRKGKTQSRHGSFFVVFYWGRVLPSAGLDFPAGYRKERSTSPLTFTSRSRRNKSLFYVFFPLRSGLIIDSFSSVRTRPVNREGHEKNRPEGVRPEETGETIVDLFVLSWKVGGQLESCAYLWIRQLSVLQAGHVAPKAELLAMKSLQILLPGCDLGSNLASALRLGHDRQLQFGHVFQFVILRQIIGKENFFFKCARSPSPKTLMANYSVPVWKCG